MYSSIINQHISQDISNHLQHRLVNIAIGAVDVATSRHNTSALAISAVPQHLGTLALSWLSHSTQLDSTQLELYQA